MTVDIICPECGKVYDCNISTTRMIGPILETRCPFCRIKSSKNLSAFVFKQGELRRITGYIATANFMIHMSVEMGKLINEDVPYSNNTRKLGKKNELPEL